MQVLFDNHIFNAQRFGGISRYAFELVEGISKRSDVRVEFPVRYSSNSYLLSARERYGIKPMPGKGSPLRGFFASHRLRANHKCFREAAGRCEFDIYHPTYHDETVLQSMPDGPFVMTIYDMIHELFPELFGDGSRIADVKRQMARNAKLIIAISENTKRDIITLLGIPDERIRVIHIAQSLSGGTATDGTLPHRYLLFVGNRGLYKNFKALAEAVGPLLTEDRALHLICAGAGPFSVEELAQLERLKVQPQVRHVPLKSDEHLAQIYRGARCFIFPSRYEGFGIPALEAFACGCPALLANTSSLPEVGEDAAEYFDPESPESIRDATRRVLEDEALRGELVRKGRERVREFSWEKVCDQTVDVYRQALDR